MVANECERLIEILETRSETIEVDEQDARIEIVLRLDAPDIDEVFRRLIVGTVDQPFGHDRQRVIVDIDRPKLIYVEVDKGIGIEINDAIDVGIHDGRKQQSIYGSDGETSLHRFGHGVLEGSEPVFGKGLDIIKLNLLMVLTDEIHELVSVIDGKGVVMERIIHLPPSIDIVKHIIDIDNQILIERHLDRLLT